MTAPDLHLGEITARANNPFSPENTRAQMDEDRDYLLAELRARNEALGRVEALAEMWHKRGEHDMAYSKTIPDEDIAMAILTDGAQKVENARHIRNAVRTAVAAATGGGE